MQMRAFNAGDHASVLALAPRLQIGVAKWRDPSHVRAAVHSWVGSSVQRAGDPDSVVYVADNGNTVGFVSVTEREHFTGEIDGYVGELVVDESHAGAGVGRALMAKAEEWARQRGRARLILEIGAQNTGARSFYAALGL